ncbi:hypothetical protein LGN17_22460 [Burkholderia sp. AU30280]|uniref:hypothetical protein n=1 Tax=Burkholderia sp. AU30280 TaxID=2879628 RepID=UPI001CF12598|nr:hypothetical protein [Burkholderia sp. AU30280]MCA8275253.1 hypothetical protein [Burkholderia sp. AU30280]
MEAVSDCSNLASPPAAPLDASSDSLLDRFERALNHETCIAWKIHNTLAFMVEALPEDTEGSLPTACLLRELQTDLGKLATTLGDLPWKVRHG